MIAQPEIRLLLPSVAARMLGISHQRLLQLSAAGALPVAAKTSTGWRLYHPADVERLAEQRALARVGADGHGDGPKAA